MNALDDSPTIIIGAGPTGLAAAAHLHERGLPFTVLEAGDIPGAAVRQWGHVRVFSPWRYNIDPAARRLLDEAGWVAPDPGALPTGAELVDDYLRPLAQLPQLKPHVRYGARVEAISRLGLDRLRTAGRDTAPFLLRLADGDELVARAVIDASGTWGTPNVLGASGLRARGRPMRRRTWSTRCQTSSAPTGAGSPDGTQWWSAPVTRPRTPCCPSRSWPPSSPTPR